MSEITRILESIKQGDSNGSAELLPLVYKELRKLAAHKMLNEAAGHTLQPTALVHEAWLRLAGEKEAQQWSSRAHFFGAAAEAMRRILIEKARRKKRERHGRGWTRVDLDGLDLAATTDGEMLLRVDEALTKFAEENKKKAELVNLRFYVGLSIPEAAEQLGLSPTTANRYWAYARAWLYAELSRDG